MPGFFFQPYFANGSFIKNTGLQGRMQFLKEIIKLKTFCFSNSFAKINILI